MARPTETELIRLLENPVETLTIEHKGWLDLSLNPHKAILAKAAIALENEGGGIIVLGTSENITQGGQLGSYPRPSILSRYNQDNINAAIARFSDPQFHCELMFATHPDTGTEHAFVVVPGETAVPVMSTRGSDGEIEQQRCYVRKPGPKSEEAYTAEEWRRLLNRCIRAGREDMLEAIRGIVQGYTETGVIPPSAKDNLMDFINASQVRWQSLIEPLASDDPARTPLGYYEIAFSILDIEQPISLNELRRLIDQASNVHLTGWPPFLYLHREPYLPHSIDGTVEVWLGEPSEERHRDEATVDFWRASPTGQFYLLRGYIEDTSGRVAPGTGIDVGMPIWRVGETLLFASRLAKLIDDNPEILVFCRYTGLHNRHFYEARGFGSYLEDFRCIDDAITLETQVDANQINDNLPEVLLTLLSPLYESFSFFQLDPPFVAEHVRELRGRRH